MALYINLESLSVLEYFGGQRPRWVGWVLAGLGRLPVSILGFSDADWNTRALVSIALGYCRNNFSQCDDFPVAQVDGIDSNAADVRGGILRAENPN